MSAIPAIYGRPNIGIPQIPVEEPPPLFPTTEISDRECFDQMAILLFVACLAGGFFCPWVFIGAALALIFLISGKIKIPKNLDSEIEKTEARISQLQAEEKKIVKSGGETAHFRRVSRSQLLIKSSARSNQDGNR